MVYRESSEREKWDITQTIGVNDTEVEILRTQGKNTEPHLKKEKTRMQTNKTHKYWNKRMIKKKDYACRGN